MLNERFSRQVLAFGSKIQNRLAKINIGVVGAGGLGSQVCQNFAYLGAEKFLIVDDDIVEESNLNRMVGALPDDAVKKRLKVDVIKRMIKEINPGAKVETYPSNLRDEHILDTLIKVDYLFGCVDNDSARLILTELSSAYEIPFIDAAFEIQTENGKIRDFGGRVIVAIPGDFCALCANQIDTKVAQIELESPAEREFRERHGYGLGSEVTAPAVITLNTIVGGIAVTEFLMLITNIRPPNRMVTYKGIRGIVTSSLDKKKNDCIVCNFLAGKRGSADIKRYAQFGLPKDLPIQ